MRSSITLAEVAHAARTSTYTASRALRGLTGVSTAARNRVLEAARELGYRGNHPASMLARQRQQVSAVRIGVAVLSDRLSSWDLLHQAAQELNIDLHLYDKEAFPSAESASRILWHRGASGALITFQPLPWSEEERKRFAWERFSLVKMTRGKPDVPCHLIRHSAFDYMARTLREVVQRGYRRIVVLTSPSEAPHDDDARYGAIANCRDRSLPDGVRLFSRDIQGFGREISSELAKWIRAKQPDVIVGFQFWWIRTLREAGFRVPEDIAMAAVLTEDDPVSNAFGVSGCHVRKDEHYRRALSLLLELVARGERGFPQQVLEHVVEPEWFEGKTLPAK